MPTTPNMGLTLPVVSGTVGPDWATYLNAAFQKIDSHTHVAASATGLPIPTAALNINADLTFGSYNATALRTTRFTDQAAPLAVATDKGCLYTVLGDLYYNNGSGTAIKVTSGTSINASAVGGIGGDYVTAGASVFYTSPTKLFSFQSVTSPAGSIIWSAMGHGPVTIYDTAAGVSKGITLKSPAALAAAYNVTLPAALPASTLPVQMDTAGVLTLAQITTAQITPLNVTRATMAAVGQQVSTSSGAFTTASAAYVDVTNMTVTITTTGRPVMLCLQAAAGAIGQMGTAVTAAVNAAQGQFALLRGVSTITEWFVGIIATATATPQLTTQLPPGLSYLDVVAAGTYTYKIQAKTTSATTTIFATNMVLVAYEL